MPFGNSVSTSSHEFEMQGTLNRLRLQQPRPGFYGLSHAARTTARAAFVDQAVSHEGVSAAHDSVFQPIGQDPKSTRLNSSHTGSSYAGICWQNTPTS